LISILRRRIIDRLRKKRPPQPIDPSLQEQQQSVEPDDPFADHYSDEMQRSLNRLPAELRESLLLVVVGELTHQEVADELSIPLGTVLSRVSRARSRLREYLTTEITKS
jgi:RNA polymerase sigma-70 factor (ECF subfamily)